MAQPDLWGYDKIQFARLIAEAEAAGVFDEQAEPFQLMCESMDLGADGVRELIDRAQTFWDTYKTPEMRPRDRPMTVAEARNVADEDSFIAGVVMIDVDDLVEGDLESALDRLGESLVEGGDLLMEISQTVVGQQGDTLYVEVSGDASLIFDSADDGAEEDEDTGAASGCYYGDPDHCSGGLWTCLTCKQDYCEGHWHETDKGRNVECVACERARKEEERDGQGKTGSHRISANEARLRINQLPAHVKEGLVYDLLWILYGDSDETNVIDLDHEPTKIELGQAALYLRAEFLRERSDGPGDPAGPGRGDPAAPEADPAEAALRAARPQGEAAPGAAEGAVTRKPRTARAKYTKSYKQGCTMCGRTPSYLETGLCREHTVTQLGD